MAIESAARPASPWRRRRPATAPAVVSAIAGALAAACEHGPPATTAHPSSAPASRPSLVIENVTVVNPASAPASRGPVRVVVRDGRIAAVGDAAEIASPAGAVVVDATGKYLIPGLWDMHVHTVGREAADHFAPLFIANGVTAVRDMGDDLATLSALRTAIVADTIVAPRLYFGGRVDGAGPRPPYALAAATPEEAGRAVDSLAAAGVDFIKIPATLGRAEYYALVIAAERRALRTAGHVTWAVTAAEASAAGQASLEHEDDLMLACTSRELELKRRIADASRTGDAAVIGPVMREVASFIRASADERACAALAATLSSNRTWLVPTLVVYQPYARGFDAAVTNDDRLRYIPAALRAAWRRRVSERAAEDHALVTSFFSLARTREFHEAGVRLMTGTDAPLPYVFPGFSVHEEMQLLVAAGQSPAQALRAATAGPAEFMGLADSTGTVAAGKWADLVLLDGDPLEEIENTLRIRGVVLRGRYFSRTALDSLLAAAEAAAR